MDTRPIGMLDSGVGGVTVLAEIKKILPKEKIIYYGDTLNFPYGNKSKEAIVNLTKKGISFLISKGVKAIVIACGTATSQALEEIQSQYTIPIIGIIEPTIQEIKKRNYKCIGIIGTVGTINSGAWEKYLKKVLPSSKIYSKACPLLAPMAEEGWTDNEIARLTVKEYIEEFKNKKLEGLILGCTHYPFFKKWIQQELGKEVYIFDTGEMVSRTLEHILQEKKLQNDREEKKVDIYVTGTKCKFEKILEEYLPNKQIEYSILYKEEK